LSGWEASLGGLDNGSELVNTIFQEIGDGCLTLQQSPVELLIRRATRSAISTVQCGMSLSESKQEKGAVPWTPRPLRITPGKLIPGMIRLSHLPLERWMNANTVLNARQPERPQAPLHCDCVENGRRSADWGEL